MVETEEILANKGIRSYHQEQRQQREEMETLVMEIGGIATLSSSGAESEVNESIELYSQVRSFELGKKASSIFLYDIVRLAYFCLAKIGRI